MFSIDGGCSIGEIIGNGGPAGLWSLVDQIVVFIDGEAGRDVERDGQIGTEFGDVTVGVMELDVELDLVSDFDALGGAVL